LTPRVLVADDERDIVAPLSYALRRAGYDVDAVGDGEAALQAARTSSYDAVILDVMMPKLSGTEVCRRLRAESTVPIIMLTAKDAEVERVVGLELGADDYVTKPFSVRELISRVGAVLRRRELDRASGGEPTIHVGGVKLDLPRHEVNVDGRDVSLTPSEFKLLAFLAQRPGQVFSRAQLLEHLWQSPHIGTPRACDVHISNLRRKIERDPNRPERILTVREIGYKLVSV
jgi:two-component system, OmpR family, response regulator RegX3